VKNIRFFAIIVTTLIISGLFISCEKEASFDNNQPVTILKSQQSAILLQSSQVQFNLMAGQHHDAGDIVISFDDEMLYITFQMQNDWQMGEIQLWAGLSLSEMSQTRNGNPQLVCSPTKCTT